METAAMNTLDAPPAGRSLAERAAIIDTRVLRLTELRRVVEAAPDDLFDMSRFSRPTPTCGTAHCAAGWAAVDPWFQRNTPIREIFAVDVWGHVGPCGDDSAFGDLAVMFGLDSRDADHLFGGTLDFVSDAFAVPKVAVLANIDRLLCGLPAEPYMTEEE